MKITNTFLVIAFFIGISYQVKSQTRPLHDTDLVQFTGFVVSYDSTKTIPFVTIRIAGSSRGTYSDMQGYFSFVAKKSDMIVLSCIGYEPKIFNFPNDIVSSRFKTVVTMVEDTFFLPDFVKNATPTPDEIDYMFSRSKLPLDQYAIAQQNLRRKPLAEMSEALSYDGYENARYAFNQYANKAYYNGQTQPIPVLDVFAWSKFLKSLQNGEFKRK
ncbi:MAG: carboxypeptidase-like regulatory domain-containing protein [Bacteroidia bacterium]|nr:carboxypeptidase-like regulatory domain-containing protein [Bacteroidia bacterium]